MGDLGTGSLPMTMMVAAWSGTADRHHRAGDWHDGVSYGRPYQHVHFYEIDNQIRKLSLKMPSRKITTWPEYDKAPSESRTPPMFNYLERAIERGSTVQVLMGDARLRMALPYKNHYEDGTDHGGGPNNFYHMMVVDAFSSDAIPAHLLTEEAFKMYFDRLTEEGILCVHTSNRFVDLPKVVSAVAAKLGYVHLRGHDVNDNHAEGHYTSEWVMVAHRKGKKLANDDYDDYLKGSDRRHDSSWITIGKPCPLSRVGPAPNIGTACPPILNMSGPTITTICSPSSVGAEIEASSPLPVLRERGQG